MAAPVVKAVRGWPDLVLGLQNAVLQHPGLSQIDKEFYHKPLAKLTEKFDQELRKTQLIKAAPAMKTNSMFEDPLISKFTNMMMKGGNKVLARFLRTQTLEAVKRKQFEKYRASSAEERNPYTIFHQALKNCEPMIGLVPIPKGGHFYSVPVLLADWHRHFLDLKWMITECREKQHQRRLILEKLSHELLQAF
ncbi:28S ribosomal protein S7, mitochondrial [Pteropus alecto]|uniref:28S ribosomal protein S7, mitochondrial n=1 Tax=Pteropus alecto TaxID=9402 RepID=L5K5L6_PTEAL|nr:28S ribosomal protein S7, mitochondrial [Pteropus alecto]